MPHPSDRFDSDDRDEPLYVHDIVNAAPACPLAPMPEAGCTVIDHDTALALLAHLAPGHHDHAIVVVLLDHQRRGRHVVCVTGTVDPDAVLHVVDRVAAAAVGSPDIGAAIVASYRPHGSDELDDLERWLTIDEEFALSGIELVEWYVFGGSVSRPRALLGEPTRWVA